MRWRGRVRTLAAAVLVAVSSGTPSSDARAAQLASGAGIDVTTRGAVADGKTDSTAAIQRAIDEIAARPTRGRLFFPAGRDCYVVTAPIEIHSSGLRLEGESYGAFGTGTCIRAQGFVGPLLHLTSESADVRLVPSLVNGPGRALATSAVSFERDSYLDFQDAAASAQLDGLTAFTAELFFRIDAEASAGGATLLGSFGSLGGADVNRSAFSFDLNRDRQLTGRLNVSGTTISIASSAALKLGQVYHAALTFDGSAVRLFVGLPNQASALIGMKAASGSVTQSLFEMMPLGGRRNPWPHGGPYLEPVTGALDSIRLSRTARYTASFVVPARKFAVDPATLVLENFENETPDWSIVQSSSGRIFLPKYPAFAGHILNELEFSHLELQARNGEAIWAHGVTQSHFHDLSLWAGVFGFNGDTADFLNAFDRVRVTGSGLQSRLGMGVGGAGGITSYRNMTFTAWPVSALVDSGSGVFDTIFCHGARQRIALVLRESSFQLNSVFVSNEDADPGFEADLRLVRNPNVAISGGTFEHFVSDGPAIQIDGGAALTLSAPYFRMRSGAREVFAFMSPPTNKPLILNGAVDPPTPWTISGQVSVLP